MSKQPWTLERLLARTTPNGDCLEWTGAYQNAGYGNCGYEIRLAHRASYSLANDIAKSDMPPVVRHTCDNRKCINPIHLIGGTQADNMQDASDRGRTMRGRKAKRFGDDINTAKLSDTECQKILYEYQLGLARNEIADLHSVSLQYITSLINSKSRKHLVRNFDKYSSKKMPKLTATQVIQIKENPNGLTGRELAKYFDCSTALISRIKAELIYV